MLRTGFGKKHLRRLCREQILFRFPISLGQYRYRGQYPAHLDTNVRRGLRILPRGLDGEGPERYSVGRSIDETTNVSCRGCHRCTRRDLGFEGNAGGCGWCRGAHRKNHFAYWNGI